MWEQHAWLWQITLRSSSLVKCSSLSKSTASIRCASAWMLSLASKRTNKADSSATEMSMAKTYEMSTP